MSLRMANASGQEHMTWGKKQKTARSDPNDQNVKARKKKKNCYKVKLRRNASLPKASFPPFPLGLQQPGLIDCLLAAIPQTWARLPTFRPPSPNRKIMYYSDPFVPPSEQSPWPFCPQNSAALVFFFFFSELGLCSYVYRPTTWQRKVPARAPPKFGRHRLASFLRSNDCSFSDSSRRHGDIYLLAGNSRSWWSSRNTEHSKGWMT